ncbi:MAG: hypothetical protein EAZ55_09670 [Cytophagales bacterium]|nr:MAG: hypothetical protein EAZ55_09670 [Cytophagales bacterium]
MNAYSITLFLHSWLRWAVLVLALIVIVKSLMGVLNKSNYTKQDNIFSASLTGLMHLQLLIGLLLYFVLSPITTQNLGNMSAMMKIAAIRYWAVEHITVMIAAVVLVQVGRSISKKATASLKKHRTMLLFTTIALVLILSRIPWDSVRLFRGL